MTKDILLLRKSEKRKAIDIASNQYTIELDRYKKKDTTVCELKYEIDDFYN